MGGREWIRSRLLRWSRKAYNEGNYSTSLRRSRISNSIIKDPAFFDISARSAINLEKFELASSIYRKAKDLGLSLRNHSKNHFLSELNSGNLVEAYRIVSSDTSDSAEKRKLDVVSKIDELTEKERVKIIQEIGEKGEISEDLAKLLPWKAKKIKINSKPESFYLIKNEMEEIGRYRREISRIHNSAAFRILNHISTAFGKPKSIILLPLTVFGLVIRLIREKLGHVDRASYDIHPLGKNTSDNRESIIFFPTNGVGFGHFTRLLAIAKKIRKNNPDLEIVFFTTMPTLHILKELDFPTYHLSGRYRYKDMSPNVWNSVCEEMLSMVFSLHRPKAFVFDGSYPYRGMLNAIKNRENMLRVWIRRGSTKTNSRSIPVDSTTHFHAIVKPGDSDQSIPSDELDRGVAMVRCNPILLVDSDEMEPYGRLRRRLGIPAGALLCYVQLGAGNINNINSELFMVLEAISKHSHVYVVVGESMLGKRILAEFERVRILRDYPNSRYFRDFDFAVMAGGYNSFHEVIEAEIPTICFPNMKTGRDDQYRRVKVAQDAGCMVVIKERKMNTIQAAVDRIIEAEVRELMRNNFKAVKRENGANQVSDWILSQLE